MRMISTWLKSNLDIDISNYQLNLLMKFKNIVLEKNKVMNLTAITDDHEFMVKHVIDSFTLLPLIPQGSKVIDVGTGAGFPGIILKIMRDDIKLSLMDSRKKRIDFLEEALHLLELTDIRLINSRSEDWAKKSKERFDICTARAVAELNKLAAYTLPLIKRCGVVLAMKGPDVLDELEKAKTAIKKFGGEVGEVKTYEIADGIKRSIVTITKKTSNG